MLREKLPRFAFSGTVLEIDDNHHSYVLDVTFKVLKSWKHKLRGTILIVSSRGGDCGFPFKVGETYLVYAELVDSTASGTKICKRSLKLSDAGKELKMLDRRRSRRKNRA